MKIKKYSIKSILAFITCASLAAWSPLGLADGELTPDQCADVLGTKEVYNADLSAAQGLGRIVGQQRLAKQQEEFLHFQGKTSQKIDRLTVYNFLPTDDDDPSILDRRPKESRAHCDFPSSSIAVSKECGRLHPTKPVGVKDIAKKASSHDIMWMNLLAYQPVENALQVTKIPVKHVFLLGS
ncbi:MAG: hypothetical protein WCG04_07220 [Alphaproteobacteria bacterium]